MGTFRGFLPEELSELKNRATVEEHADAAVFGWQLRERIVHSHQYRLAHLTRSDERLLANLEGLMLAGSLGLELSNQALEEEPHAGSAFVVGAIALQQQSQETFDHLLELARDTPPVARGLVSAIAWVGWEASPCWRRPLLESDDPFHCHLAAKVFRLCEWSASQHLGRWLTAPSAALRAEVARLAGEQADAGVVNWIDYLATEANDSVAFWAIRSQMLLRRNTAESLARLRGIAIGGGRCSALAAYLHARGADARSGWKLYEEVRAMGGSSASMFAALALGHPAVIPDLLTWMPSKTTGRLAGMVFELITGVCLSAEHLDAERSDEEEDDDGSDALENSGEDSFVKSTHWDALVQPDPERVCTWWAKEQPRFDPHVQYFRGKPVTGASRAEALAEGTQLERWLAALDVALNEAVTPLFSVEARATEQTRRLALAKRSAV